MFHLIPKSRKREKKKIVHGITSDAHSKAGYEKIFTDCVEQVKKEIEKRKLSSMNKQPFGFQKKAQTPHARGP